MDETNDIKKMPRRTILAACCGGMMTISFSLASLAMCLTSIGQEFKLDNEAKGLLGSAPFWGFPVAILLSGPLADRVGFRWLLVLGAICQSAGLAMVWASGGFWAAWTGAVILGLGCGVLDALLTPIVCKAYPDKRVGATSLLHSFYAIGLIATVSLLMVLFAMGWPWRSMFALLAVLCLPLAVLVLVLPLPKQTHEGETRQRARDISRQGAFLSLVMCIFLVGVAEIGPSTWLPAYVVEAAGGERWAGGLGLVLFGVTMSISRLSTSALGHRLGVRRLFSICSIISAVSLLMAALPVATWWTVGWLAVLGLGIGGCWPMIQATAGDRYPAAGASMFSLLSAAGNIGGVVGPWSIGLVSVILGLPSDSRGLRAAMALLAVTPLIALVLFYRVGQQRVPRS